MKGFVLKGFCGARRDFDLKRFPPEPSQYLHWLQITIASVLYSWYLEVVLQCSEPLVVFGEVLFISAAVGCNFLVLASGFA